MLLHGGGKLINAYTSDLGSLGEKSPVLKFKRVYCKMSKSRSAPSSIKSPSTAAANREVGCWMNASTKRARTQVVSQSAEVVLSGIERQRVRSERG